MDTQPPSEPPTGGPDPHRLDFRNALHNAWVRGSVGIVTAALGTVALFMSNILTYTGPAPWTRETTQTTNPPAAEIAITPPGDLVGACLVMKGTGTAPAGKVIWAAQRATGDERRGYFDLAKAVVNSPGHWQARIRLGTRGETFEVVVFILSEESTRLLDNLEVHGEGGSFQVLRNLPVEMEDSETVTRDVHDTTDCVQGSS